MDQSRPERRCTKCGASSLEVAFFSNGSIHWASRCKVCWQERAHQRRSERGLLRKERPGWAQHDKGKIKALTPVVDAEITRLIRQGLSTIAIIRTLKADGVPYTDSKGLREEITGRRINYERSLRPAIRYTSREELAWAAGLFDGEGWMGPHMSKARNGNTPRSGRISVSQSGNPEVLYRFYEAVGKIGTVCGPYGPYKGSRQMFYHWTCARQEEVQAVIVMLWPFLSGVKKAQARKVLMHIKRKKVMTPDG